MPATRDKTAETSCAQLAGISDQIFELAGSPLFQCMTELGTAAKSVDSYSSHTDNLAAANQLKLLVVAVLKELPQHVAAVELGLKNVQGKLEQVK